jgi:signal recognition particle protein
MLNKLSDRLGQVVKNIRGQARLSEENIADALREVRLALLEADVALPVVKAFMNLAKEKAMGREVIGSLNPSQAFIGVVDEVLTELMGQENSELNLAAVPPAVILMAGLQGAGKTTTVGKLAYWLLHQSKKSKNKILLASADIYRPAAIEQLRLLAGQVGVDFFENEDNSTAEQIAVAALNYAKKQFYDVLLIDTAGRLTVDEVMMKEIKDLHDIVQPVETLFVLDAMLGQDAVNTAKAFNEALPLTGIILSKLDGDSRGGAALSARYVTGKPIKFVGMGEKINALEAFYPDRLASRILGMGDVLGLIEDVQRGIDEQAAQTMVKKLHKGKSFDLNDFYLQLQQMKKMGGIENLMQKLPGSQALAERIPQGMAEKTLKVIEAIINSMTAKEKANPSLLKASRKRRIAQGSGTSVQEVNKLLKQFEEARKVMRQFNKGGMGKLMRIAQKMPGLKDLMPR